MADVIQKPDTDNFDDLFKDAPQGDPGDLDNFLSGGDDGNDPVPEPGAGGNDPEPGQPGAQKPQGKITYENLLKSFKSQQRFVSQMQGKFKEIEENNKKREEQEKLKTQKLMEAFGLDTGDKSEEEAKKLMEKFQENPMTVIETIIQKKLDAVVPELEQKVELTNIDSKVARIKDDIENEFEFEFTPQIEAKVAQILKSNFTKSYKLNHPKDAILTAVKIATGKALEKREDSLIFIDKGKVSGNMPKIKSEKDKIKKGIADANPNKKFENLFK